jgi:hypothetical protein
VFFRAFFGIVVFGSAHGLILLPVLLSWMGVASNKVGEEGDHKKVESELEGDGSLDREMKNSSKPGEEGPVPSEPMGPVPVSAE